MFLGKMQFSPDENFLANLRLLRMNDNRKSQDDELKATKRTKFALF